MCSGQVRFKCDYFVRRRLSPSSDIYVGTCLYVAGSEILCVGERGLNVCVGGGGGIECVCGRVREGGREGGKMFFMTAALIWALACGCCALINNKQ